MIKGIKILLVLAIGCCVCCCERSEPYPATPEIHIKKLEILDITDTLGVTLKSAQLSFSFVDGDGDLGVRDTYIDSSYIHVIWYQKQPNGNYQQCMVDNKMIPYREVMNKDEAFNKTLKGTIKSIWDLPRNRPNLDTVYMEFFINDRAFNQSNVEITPHFSVFADTTFVY